MELINGDVLTELKKIEDNSVDCIITSPPYWKGFEYEAYFNSYHQYINWSKKWLSECKRVLSKDGYFYLNVCNDSETTWGHSGFPLALAETCILLSTNEGDTVMDCFMGSGTTGVACKKFKRNFIGVELDTEYYNIAKDRIKNTEISLI